MGASLSRFIMEGMKKPSTPINVRVAPPMTNQVIAPMRSATGPAIVRPRGAIAALKLMRRVKTLPCISGGMAACIAAKNVPLAMEFKAEKRKKAATARRSMDPGMKPKSTMKRPPTARAD